MAATNLDGPQFVYGNMSQMNSSVFGTGTDGQPIAVPDPNPDAGPNGVFQGVAFLDCRYWFGKDKVTGYSGVVPAHLMLPVMRSAGAIPLALASNNIAAAQHVVNGTAMTLAAASVGVDTNIPIWPFSPANINGPGANQTATSVLALDFGFAYGTTVVGSANITVANASDFEAGEPLVIAGAGNTLGTAPLLASVTAINTTTNVITVSDNALFAQSAAAIGTGNVWATGPNTAFWSPTNTIPTAALPFIAAGPALILDPRQAIARGIQIVGVSGGAGGNFLVSGFDIYNEPMTALITVAAGASTGWSTKCFKYIVSVVPQFTDAHNYTVGTSDVFGFNYKAGAWDDTAVGTCWAAAEVVSSTGFTAAVGTNPATSSTGDVRGTLQVSANGGGSGVGSTASNGTISTLARTGNRLTLLQTITPFSATQAFPVNPVSVYGVTNA